MIEEAWKSEESAETLLRLLPRNFSRRKLRHFVCRFVWSLRSPWLGSDDEGTLVFAEQIADDEANVDADKWVTIYQGLRERWGPDFDGQIATLLTWTVEKDIYEGGCWVVDERVDAENEQAVALLREIFGNPFRPIDFAPWRTDTAVTLARQMYEARDFGAMPILADALQDAGCDNTDVLTHCRDANQTHVRGCWVVDGVLGKE